MSSVRRVACGWGALARVGVTACVIGIGLSLGGCESFDLDKIMAWLDTKKPLPGERKELFPGGVPGIEKGVPAETRPGYQAEEPAAVPPPTDQAAKPKEANAETAEKPKPKPRPKKTATASAPAPQAAPTDAAPAPAAAAPWPGPQGQAQSAGSPWPSATPQQQQQPTGSPWPSAPATGTFSR